MRYRNREQGPESNYRPWRERNADPQHDEDYGMRGNERREYRGRESYEQQSRGGEGGRSGMWDHRFVPRDLDEPYRNNSDEDRRGYQNISRRSEFQSASGPAYGRYDRSNYGRYDDDDEARFGFDARDYNREFSGPYSQREDYLSNYDDRPAYRRYGGYGGNYGSRAWNDSDDRYYDQGRVASGAYGRSQFQRRLNQGPKGYKRSDERIREDVCDRLGHDWDLDASEVEVAVSNGEVTLTGTVADRTQKFRIEHIADGVSGVGEVHNQIRVKRESASTQSGATQSQSFTQAGRSTANQNRSS